MQFSPRNAFIAAAAMACLVAPAIADARTTNVRFARGGTAATYSGTVRGYGYDSYVFQAREGQSLTVTLSTDKVDAVLFGEDGVDLSEAVSLPRSGRYEIRVMQMRTFARRGRSVPYRLTVGIR